MRANHRFISLNGTWKLQGRKELPGKDISANWDYAEFSTSATVPGNLELELEKDKRRRGIAWGEEEAWNPDNP